MTTTLTFYSKADILNSISIWGSTQSNIMLCVLAPSAVRNLNGVAMLFSVMLTWREPDPLNGILNRYTIRYSVNGSSEITNTTRDTTFSITDLNPNTVVSNIRVIAATGAGDGPPQMSSDITTLDRPCECWRMAPM